MLTLGTFAAGTDLLVIAGILPAMATQLSVSISSAGLLVTAFAITYALASPILTTITTTVNRRILLVSALGLFTAGNALSALAPNYDFLMLARIITGVGVSLYTPTAYATASLLVPQELRGRALATVVAGFTISTVIGVPVGSFVGDAFGWRITFWLVTVMGLVSLIVLGAIFPSVEGTRYAGFKARFSPVLKPSIALSLGTITMWAISTWAFYTYIAPLLNHYADLSGSAISALLLFVGVGSIAGNAIGGYGADRFGALSTGTLSLVSRTALFVTVPLISISILGASSAMFLYGLLSWMIFVPQQAHLLTLAPEASSIVLSLNNSFLYGGGAVGSAIGGAVLSNYSFFGLIVVVVAFNAVALGFQLSTRKLATASRIETVADKSESAVAL